LPNEVVIQDPTTPQTRRYTTVMIQRSPKIMSVCIDNLISWMMVNRLQINPATTEVLWCSSAHRQHQMPSDPVRVGNTSVLSVSVVHDLGVYLDADLSMRAHITATVRTCFVALRQIRSVCRSLTQMLCWLCSAHSSLTSVVQRWLVCLEHCCRD